MIKFDRAVRDWGSEAFADTLKHEIEQLDAAQLPLQQGLSHSSYVSDEPHYAIFISASDDATVIHARVDIHYSGIIAGCACADDPTPLDISIEMCELSFDIDKHSAETSVTLLP